MPQKASPTFEILFLTLGNIASFNILPLYRLPLAVSVVGWVMVRFAATIEPDRGHGLECAKFMVPHHKIAVKRSRSQMRRALGPFLLRGSRAR